MKEPIYNQGFSMTTGKKAASKAMQATEQKINIIRWENRRSK